MTNQKDFLPELPKGWAWTRLGEILSVVKGKKPEKLGAKDEFLTIPYVNIKAFEKKVFSQFTDGNGCTFCEPDDVLIVWDGARCGLVGRGVAGAIGSTLANLVRYELNSAYLFHFLQTKYEYINSRPRGVGIPHVEPGIFWEIEFPLSPIPEQHRIIYKIEELFTRLDAGVEGLKKVKAQLSRYRQAVLKHAFEGKLTEEWREAHKGQMEPASVLLERIKEERKRNVKGKLKELPRMDLSDLAELPEGWRWAVTNDVCSSVRDGTHETPKYVEEGVPLITSKNLKENGLDFTTARNISIEDHEKIGIRSGVEKGDVLFAMIGTVGNPVVVQTDRVFSIKNVGLFKKNESYLRSEYLRHWLASWVFMKILEKKELLKGTTQKFIPLEHLRILPIPAAPLSEQHQIMSEIERCFSVAGEIEKVVEQSLKQAERLRQSILKRAFEGKLVPQDPTDEPAENLLERMRAESARIEAKKKATGKTRRS